MWIKKWKETNMIVPNFNEVKTVLKDPIQNRVIVVSQDRQWLNGSNTECGTEPLFLSPFIRHVHIA